MTTIDIDAVYIKNGFEFWIHSLAHDTGQVYFARYPVRGADAAGRLMRTTFEHFKRELEGARAVPKRAAERQRPQGPMQGADGKPITIRL
jgi:hypothetical protein